VHPGPGARTRFVHSAFRRGALALSETKAGVYSVL